MPGLEDETDALRFAPADGCELEGLSRRPRREAPQSLNPHIAARVPSQSLLQGGGYLFIFHERPPAVGLRSPMMSWGTVPGARSHQRNPVPPQQERQ